jgi:hypothetical protein
MLGDSQSPAERRTPALITGLTILALGAMAMAIPPARLTPKVTGVQRGFVVSSGSFSDLLAELLNGHGYTYMAVDLTQVPVRAGEIWRDQFNDVSRIFPVWGWVDVRSGAEQAKSIAAALPLSGLYLYGAKPADVEAVRAARPGLTVVPVVRVGETWTGKGEAAVAFPPDRFAEAAKASLPVLLVQHLDTAAREAARGALPGNYVICSIPVLD